MKLALNGLDLLTPVSLKVKIDIESLEKKFEIQIPFLFRVFTESFQWNGELVYGKEFYYYQELAGGEISFPFKSIEHHLVSSLGTTDDEVTDRKLILFAVNRFGFYIGTKGNDADKILTKTNMSEGFKVVAGNVFEFLRGVTNSLSDVADAEQEYRKYMYALGYDGEDMEQEIADWRLYKRGFKH